MARRSTAAKVALAVIGLVMAWNLWRAAAQSCSENEAITFNEFASKPLAKVLTLPATPQNQVLHTLFCHWIMQFLGVSEITLRLASLLGGLLFLITSYRLCRFYLGDGWRFLVVFTATAANPFTLNYFSVARGESLAAAFFLLAACELSLHRRLSRASVFLALSAAASLPFVLPAVALVLGFSHVEYWNRKRFKLWPTINQLILPGTAVAAALLLLPLTAASRIPWPSALPSRIWPFDSATKTIMLTVRNHMTGPLMIGGSENLQQNLTFYRRRYHMNGLTVIGFDLLRADFLVLDEGTTALPGFFVLYRDNTTGEVLLAADRGQGGAFQPVSKRAK